MITPSFSLAATERVLPKLALDFTTGSLDSRITFTRALNTATVVDSSGNLVTVNANLPRFDYDPTTLACKGLLIEESRTNSLTNNTMVGAVAGSPGTAPTSWFPTTTTGVFTRTIVGTGTENGVSYIDIRYQASGSGTASVQFENGVGVIPASNGQTWTFSSYTKLVGGSLTNVTVNDTIVEDNAAGGFLAGGNSANYVPTSASLITQRRTYTRTNTNALTAFLYARTAIAFSGAGDVTLRFGLPQLELGAFATSVIQTSGTAVTRNADVATMTGTNFSSWWAATIGSAAVWIIPEAITGTNPAIQFDDNTSTNQICLRGNVTNPELYIKATTDQVQIDAGTIVINTAYKLTGAWNTNNCAASQNGAAAVTDVSATIPAVTQARIGSDGTNYANARIQKIMYWPQRITNNEVQAFSK